MRILGEIGEPVSQDQEEQASQCSGSEVEWPQASEGQAGLGCGDMSGPKPQPAQRYGEQQAQQAASAEEMKRSPIQGGDQQTQENSCEIHDGVALPPTMLALRAVQVFMGG